MHISLCYNTGTIFLLIPVPTILHLHQQEHHHHHPYHHHLARKIVFLAKNWTMYQTTARLEIDQNIEDKQNPTPVLASSLVFHRGLGSALGFRALNPNPDPSPNPNP
jgi:hypothetical protein